MVSAEVIRRAKRGDRDALDHVLEHALRFIQRDPYCSALAQRARDEAEDLAQEFVFRLKARVSRWWENNFQAWLRKWWRQHVFDASRKRALDTVPIDELGEEGNRDLPNAQKRKIIDCRRVEDNLARECDQARVQAIVQDGLSRLTEKQRTVLKMRFWDGKKSCEIAKELGVSESTVSSRFQRAKNNRKLREMLEVIDVRL